MRSDYSSTDSMTTASVRITVSLPADLIQRIDTDATRETRSRSQQILHLLRFAMRQPPAQTKPNTQTAAQAIDIPPT